MNIKKPINKRTSILGDQKSIRIDEILDNTFANKEYCNYEENKEFIKKVKTLQSTIMILRKMGYIIDNDYSKLNEYVQSKYNIVDYRDLNNDQLDEVLNQLQQKHVELYGHVFKDAEPSNITDINFNKLRYFMVTKLNSIFDAIGLHKWHYGKIIVLWVIATLMLFLMRFLGLLNEETVWLWTVYFVIVIFITWKWLSSRETNSSSREG